MAFVSGKPRGADFIETGIQKIRAKDVKKPGMLGLCHHYLLKAGAGTSTERSFMFPSWAGKKGVNWLKIIHSCLFPGNHLISILHCYTVILFCCSQSQFLSFFHLLNNTVFCIWKSHLINAFRMAFSSQKDIWDTGHLDLRSAPPAGQAFQQYVYCFRPSASHSGEWENDCAFIAFIATVENKTQVLYNA